MNTPTCEWHWLEECNPVGSHRLEDGSRSESQSRTKTCYCLLKRNRDTKTLKQSLEFCYSRVRCPLEADLIHTFSLSFLWGDEDCSLSILNLNIWCHHAKFLLQYLKKHHMNINKNFPIQTHKASKNKVCALKNLSVPCPEELAQWFCAH